MATEEEEMGQEEEEGGGDSGKGVPAKDELTPRKKLAMMMMILMLPGARHRGLLCEGVSLPYSGKRAGGGGLRRDSHQDTGAVSFLTVCRGLED